MNKVNPLKYLLIPFSWIYGIVIFIRNSLFNLHVLPEKKFDLPVISVGNITVGGTGKTPMTEYLLSLLSKDHKPAVLSRGYMRKSRGFIRAEKNSVPSRIGDEPCQIKNKFPDIEVAVDIDRIHGINELMKSANDLDLVILDDAFQYRYIKPGISILLVDYNRPLNRDHLLPFGNLREPASALHRADIIVVTKTPLNINQGVKDFFIKNLNIQQHQHIFFSTIKYENIKNVFSQETFTEDGTFKNPSVLIVCGIAVPSNLIEYIENSYSCTKELLFPDHHNYSFKDISNIGKTFMDLPGSDKLIITTEKDSVRIKQFDVMPREIKERFYYIPVKTEFFPEDEKKFNQLILEYVKTNKRNRPVY